MGKGGFFSKVKGGNGACLQRTPKAALWILLSSGRGCFEYSNSRSKMHLLNSLAVVRFWLDIGRNINVELEDRNLTKDVEVQGPVTWCLACSCHCQGCEEVHL